MPSKRRATSGDPPRRAKSRIAPDYGSGGLKCAVQYVPKDRNSEDVEPETVPWEDGSGPVLAQRLVAFEENIIRGDDVDDFVKEEPERAGEVLELWKLCLSPDLKDKKCTQRVWDALRTTRGNRGAIHDLIKRDLQWIKDHVLHWLKTSSPFSLLYGITDADWEDMDVELVITVPCMWDENALCIMGSAYAGAGFPKYEFAYEPICAAAHIMAKIQRSLVDFSGIVCIVDIGRGTVDIAAAKATPSDNGVRPKIKVLGRPTGRYAGAQIVNEYLTNWVVENCPDLEDLLHRLGGMGHSDFILRVGDEIEKRKQENRTGKANAFALNINAREGWADVHGGIPYHTIRTPETEVQAAFKEWSDELAIAVREHLRQPLMEQASTTSTIPAFRTPLTHFVQCKAVVLTGGGAKSKIVRDEVEKCVKAEGAHIVRQIIHSDENVCHGALKHYTEITKKKKPSAYFYILRKEALDRKAKGHRDVTEQEERMDLDEEGEVAGDVDMTDSDEGNEDRWLDDRLTLLAMRTQDKPQQDGPPIEAPFKSRRLPVDFLVETADDAYLSIVIYHSTTRLAEHGPAKNEDGHLVDRLQPYRLHEVRISLTQLRQYGFEQCKIDGEDRYRIHTIIEVGISSDEMIVANVHVLQPGQEYQFLEKDAIDKGTLLRSDGVLQPVDGDGHHRTIPELSTSFELWAQFRKNFVVDEIEKIKKGKHGTQARVPKSSPSLAPTKEESEDSTSGAIGRDQALRGQREQRTGQLLTPELASVSSSLSSSSFRMKRAGGRTPGSTRARKD